MVKERYFKIHSQDVTVIDYKSNASALQQVLGLAVTYLH